MPGIDQQSDGELPFAFPQLLSELRLHATMLADPDVGRRPLQAHGIIGHDPGEPLPAPAADARAWLCAMDASVNTPSGFDDRFLPVSPSPRQPPPGVELQQELAKPIADHGNKNITSAVRRLSWSITTMISHAVKGWRYQGPRLGPLPAANPPRDPGRPLPHSRPAMRYPAGTYRGPMPSVLRGDFGPRPAPGTSAHDFKFNGVDVHEAGHAVAALMMGRDFERVWSCDGRGEIVGVAYRDEDFIERLIILIAGEIAARRAGLAHQQSGGRDLEKSEGIVRQRFYGGNPNVIAEARARANGLIEKNWLAVLALADRLHCVGDLSGLEAAQVGAATNTTPPSWKKKRPRRPPGSRSNRSSDPKALKDSDDVAALDGDEDLRA
jgi:hypothetical protein